MCYGLISRVALIKSEKWKFMRNSEIPTTMIGRNRIVEAIMTIYLTSCDGAVDCAVRADRLAEIIHGDCLQSLDDLKDDTFADDFIVLMDKNNSERNIHTRVPVDRGDLARLLGDLKKPDAVNNKTFCCSVTNAITETIPITQWSHILGFISLMAIHKVASIAIAISFGNQ